MSQWQRRLLRGGLSAALAVALMVSCSRTSEFDRERARLQASETGSISESSATAGGGLGLGGMGNPMGMLSMFASNLDEPGPFEPPKQSPSYQDGERYRAVMSLSGAVVEMKTMSWLSPPSGLELRTITGRLRELAADENVAGLLLRVGELSLDMATAQELRDLLSEFTSDERPLHCHAEQASSLTYYVMTACTSVSMPRNGSLFVGGVAAVPMHIRGLLDRFAIEPDFVAVGSYKGAAEPLTRAAPSPQTRETLEAIIDTAHETMIADIAVGRSIPEKRARALVDRGLFTAGDAAGAGLIDRLETFEAARDGKGEPWKKLTWEEQQGPGIGQLMQFLGVGSGRPSGDRVAVIYAIGNIIDGRGEGLIGARGEVASGTLVPAIRALGRDDSVKAIVVRVASPGGSALASELIAEALGEVAERKPVVVSMGAVAASGGYYISAGAAKIFAQENTLTGSIGVVGGKLVFGRTLERYGVRSYPIHRGKNALLFSSLQPWSADERRAIRATMEEVYDVFVKRVAAGRAKTKDEILAIAEGRVWTGAAAAKNGLVDEIGGLDAAIAEARKLAELNADSPVEVYPPQPTLRDILSSFGQVAVSSDSALTRGLRELIGVGDALGAVDARVLESLIGQVMLLEATPILTAAFLPYAVR